MTWKELLDEIKEMSPEEQSEDIPIWRDDCDFTGSAIFIDRIHEDHKLSNTLDLDTPIIVYSE